MKPEELQAEIQEMTDLAKGRVISDGMKYYDKDMEMFLFESMDPDTLFRYLDEEILDAINYLGMIRIKMKHFRAALENRMYRA